jgi:hypothetical protein
MWYVGLLRWVVVNIYRVFRAVVSVLIPVRIKLDHENDATMIINSMIKTEN